MRILIVGGTGFMGPRVVRLLHEQGHEITVFHRGQTETDLPLDVHHIHCGNAPHLLNFVDWKAQLLPQFTNEFRHFAPDVVLDMVPIGERDTQAVMKTFQGIARRIVAISSIDVYRAYGRIHRTEEGPLDPIPFTEKGPLRQNLFSPFRGETLRRQDDPMKAMDDHDKIVVERVVMGHPDLPGTILRLPMVYGPGDPVHRLFEFLKRMDDGRRVIVLDEVYAGWRGSRGYVEKVVSAIALALTNERATNRIYNVGEKNALSTAEWIRAIGSAAGWEGTILTVSKDRLPPHLQDEANLSQDWVVDTSRLREELGYSESIPLNEGFKRAVAWERAHPPQEIDPKQFDYAAEDALVTQLNAEIGESIYP